MLIPVFPKLHSIFKSYIILGAESMVFFVIASFRHTVTQRRSERPKARVRENEFRSLACFDSPPFYYNRFDRFSLEPKPHAVPQVCRSGRVIIPYTTSPIISSIGKPS